MVRTCRQCQRCTLYDKGCLLVNRHRYITARNRPAVVFGNTRIHFINPQWLVVAKCFGQTLEQFGDIPYPISSPKDMDRVHIEK